MNQKLSERLRQTSDLVEFFEIPDDRVDEVVELMREAAALARRVEGAGIAHVEPKNGVAVIHERAMPLDMVGQRVALVPVEGGA